MTSNKTKPSEEGFVSIIVSMMIITVITLITIGYANAMLREQTLSLNRQLNAQAYYGAESGVNETLANIKVAPGLVNRAQSCQAEGAIVAIKDNFNADTGVNIPCVMVTDNPSKLFFQNISTNNNLARYFKIDNSTGTINKIRISWEPANGASISSVPATIEAPLPTLGSWSTNAGVVRMIIVPFTSGQGRDAIISNTGHFTMYPAVAGGSGSSVNYANVQNRPDYTGTPALANSACNGSLMIGGVAPPQKCSIIITGIPTAELHFALTSLYRANDVSVEAFSSSDVLQQITGVQYVIDSTAKSTDIIRRLNVRVAAQGGSSTRPFPSITASTEICKLIQFNDYAVNDLCGN